MTRPVETVTLGGLRYVVAVLREKDIEYLAKRIAMELRSTDETYVQRDLESEHRRQAVGYQHTEDKP